MKSQKQGTCDHHVSWSNSCFCGKTQIKVFEILSKFPSETIQHAFENQTEENEGKLLTDPQHRYGEQEKKSTETLVQKFYLG